MQEFGVSVQVLYRWVILFILILKTREQICFSLQVNSIQTALLPKYLLYRFSGCFSKCPADEWVNVKFQHTSMTSLSGFTNSGWTTAFSGTYTVPGTGLQYIQLPQPYFYWMEQAIYSSKYVLNNSTWGK